MFVMRITFILMMCIFLSSCSDESTAIGALDSGRTQESIIKKYQHLVDQNQFEEAKALTTPAEQARLDKLAAVMVSESLGETILTTNFLQINCDIEGKATYCQCLVQDDYERYEMVFKLVWTGGQWLIDAPESDGLGGEEVVDGVLDGMKEIMQ